ncbi:hypothetical protein [Mycobacteroides abscessus]|uniref:hypothetical protein n=1 Tax=Mycobacteroides abscessus TaxID=36809 RepID=UPI001F2056D0|nr:hypothetical protein [Mycobacteroides abscessus]
MNAYEKVEAAPVDYETAKRLLGHARELRSWLNAESSWRNNIFRWLEAEKQWQIHQDLINNDPAYKAAERGWLAMRDLSPRLDGVETFAQLGTLLMNRYAVFAKAVLDQQEN